MSKTFGEWYQKTNKTEDENKLTLLAFKIIAILYNILLTTFIKLLETGWSAPRPGRFTTGKDLVPIVQEAGWATGPVWTGAENLAQTGIRSPDRPVRSESP
jgi:hypothetical protein